MKAFPQALVFPPGTSPAPAKKPASPSDLPTRLLGDLATLFRLEAERSYRQKHDREAVRLYIISKDLERLWREKALTSNPNRKRDR